MSATSRFTVVVVASMFSLVAPAVGDEKAAVERPAEWAQPVEVEGVPNLFKVSDELYRSGQPSARGMRRLKEMGIETVVNLRSFHSDRDEIGNTGLAYEHIYMKAWHPEEKELVRFLQIVTNENRTPVLLHCHYGSDRTGLMCAVYRVAVQDWSKENAIEEMTGGDYGFNPVWDNLVEYIHELDVERLKRRAGLVEAPKEVGIGIAVPSRWLAAHWRRELRRIVPVASCI